MECRRVVDQENVLSEVFQLNIQGINPKVDKQKIKLRTLSDIITECNRKILFFILIETHLKEYILDAEVAIPEYNILRADRANRKNGGVAIYTHHTYSLDNTEIFTNSYCECAMAYNKQNNTVIVAVYRPPGAPINKFKECLRKIQLFKDKYEGAETLIFGDTNLKFINWTTETLQQPANIKQFCTSEEKVSSNMLLDFVNENLLIQIVNENTREDKSLIDVVFTSDEDIIFDVKVEKNNLDTDHDTVTCQLMHQRVQSCKNYSRNHTLDKKSIDNLNLEKADWKSIREELSLIDWKVLFKDASIESMCSKLEEKLLSICSKFAPERMGPTKKSSIPRNRLKLIRKRKRINSTINYLKYVKKTVPKEKLDKLNKKKLDIEAEMKELINIEIYKKEINALAQMKKNPKYFYSYVKKFQKTESRIGPLQDDKGNLSTDPETKANLLQNQYIKVFSNPKKANLTKAYREKCNVEIKDINLTVKDVTDAIKEIPLHAAPGPDKIPALLLKECADQIAEALVLIWRKSLDSGEVPEMFKLQTIIPLFKKGSKALAENYRPVSLTSHLIKLIERVLRKKIIKHIEENNLLSENQHAFRAGRSCLTQLLHHMDEVLKSLENGKNVDVVYLDFAKAFDKVDHQILMKKVYQFGIRGKLYTWIQSFISNRYQQVLVDGKLSRKEKVISGVPQGTVLGPLLFLIYIDDLESTLKHSLLRIFADDSKMVKEIKDQNDHQDLQEDLNTAITWASDNNMELNQKKFQLLQYGKEDLKVPYKTSSEKVLHKDTDVKDLGVQMSDDLSWETQMSDAVKNGRKYMGWILRSFISRNPEIIISLYQTYVIPRLEYASILWSPYKISDITRLEAIQRTISSKVDGIQDLNYHQRLYKLKLYSMQRRRERFAAIHMYKIANGLVPNNMQFEFYETSRHGLKCRKPILKAGNTHLSTVRRHFFSFIGPAIFNILPIKIKEAESLDQCKRYLDKFLGTFPDLPPTPGYPSINNNSILEWATGSYDFAEIIKTLSGGGFIQRDNVNQTERGAAVQPDST